MKVYASALVFLCVGASISLALTLEEVHKQCATEHKLTPLDIMKSKDVTITDKTFACFGGCVLQKFGVVTQNGTINKEASKALAAQKQLPDEMRESLLTCASKTSFKNLCEAGAVALKCIKKLVPSDDA